METTDGAQQPSQLPPKETSLEELAADDLRDSLRLSTKEQLILQLYDRIQELQLEISLLEAQKSPPSSFFKRRQVLLR